MKNLSSRLLAGSFLARAAESGSGTGIPGVTADIASGNVSDESANNVAGNPGGSAPALPDFSDLVANVRDLSGRVGALESENADLKAALDASHAASGGVTGTSDLDKRVTALEGGDGTIVKRIVRVETVVQPIFDRQFADYDAEQRKKDAEAGHA